MSDQDKFVKIVVDLPDCDLGVSREGLWAKVIGNNLYEVQNSPWYCREINYLDIVKAIPPDSSQHPQFISVAKRGGHRTIQLFFLISEQSRKDAILKRLNELGATWEGADISMYAIDFAKDVSWLPAREYLDQAERDGMLEYVYSAY